MFIENECNEFETKYFIFDGDYEYINSCLRDKDVNVYLEPTPFDGAKFMYCDDLSFDELLDIYNSEMTYKTLFIRDGSMSLFSGNNVNEMYYKILLCNHRFFRVCD